MKTPNVPLSIEELARDVDRQGGRAYLVGGGVRDHWLGQAVKDWDVEVFGVPSDALVRLLRQSGRVNAVGKSFGVFKWRPHRDDVDEEVDVSIPRRDSKVGPGHTGIAVEGDPSMTVEEAARRRDLTINALMWDVVGNQLTDPHGGLADLEAKRLRAVDSHTFLEDPLRALRAVQFAARLGFRTDPSLVELCREAALDELPAERIQTEWGKLLLRAATPSIGLHLARKANILTRVFPEVADLQTDPELDRLAAGPRDELEASGPQWTLMLAGWLHPAPRAAVEATLDRLWLHTVQGYPVRNQVFGVLTSWSLPIETDADLRHRSVEAPLHLSLAVRAAVRNASTDLAHGRAAKLGILHKKPAPLLLGRHLKGLGIPPGPRMGELLREVYALQLEGEVTTLDEAQAAARRLHPDG